MFFGNYGFVVDMMGTKFKGLEIISLLLAIYFSQNFHSSVKDKDI